MSGGATTSLLQTLCESFKGSSVDLIAIDMPLSHDRISGRRTSDNAISSAYGARKCSTHSPNTERPGVMGVLFQDALRRSGFELCTTTLVTPCVIEVYPHPAIVELLQASERLPYKVSRMRKYWPHLSSRDRRINILQVWARIIAGLEERIAGVAENLPLPSVEVSAKVLKSFEDSLDAVVCAWVGVCCLEKSAQAFGDELSAIWVPSAQN